MYAYVLESGLKMKLKLIANLRIIEATGLISGRQGTDQNTYTSLAEVGWQVLDSLQHMML